VIRGSCFSTTRPRRPWTTWAPAYRAVLYLPAESHASPSLLHSHCSTMPRLLASQRLNSESRAAVQGPSRPSVAGWKRMQTQHQVVATVLSATARRRTAPNHGHHGPGRRSSLRPAFSRRPSIQAHHRATQQLLQLAAYAPEAPLTTHRRPSTPNPSSGKWGLHRPTPSRPLP